MPDRDRGLRTSHHWAREIRWLGHEVRLMPPAYVKPYVKRQKNDMADAEAIYEAVTRPTMRDGAALDPADLDPSAHPAFQCDQGPHAGVWASPGPRAGPERSDSAWASRRY